MKIQLIASDGSKLLEPMPYSPSQPIKFTNYIEGDIDVIGFMLIPETVFEEYFCDNLPCDVIPLESPRLIEPENSGNLNAKISNINSIFTETFKSIPHCCSNCEYFLNIGGVKICNALQAPWESSDAINDCIDWRQRAV